MANRISYLPLSDAYKVHSGQVQMLLNKWWIYDPDKGLVFFGQWPQCNSDKSIVEASRAKYYPNTELLFVKQVCLPFVPPEDELLGGKSESENL
jgi:hypothetical protein